MNNNNYHYYHYYYYKKGEERRHIIVYQNHTYTTTYTQLHILSTRQRILLRETNKPLRSRMRCRVERMCGCVCVLVYVWVLIKIICPRCSPFLVMNNNNNNNKTQVDPGPSVILTIYTSVESVNYSSGKRSAPICSTKLFFALSRSVITGHR